jgi:hypothetical protein
MQENNSNQIPVSRRGFVTASAVAAASTAGCSGLTTQSFEAPPVGLPESEHGDLRLGETAVDPVTLDFDGPATVEVEITNHVAVYERTARDGGT